MHIELTFCTIQGSVYLPIACSTNLECFVIEMKLTALTQVHQSKKLSYKNLMMLSICSNSIDIIFLVVLDLSSYSHTGRFQQDTVQHTEPNKQTNTHDNHNLAEYTVRVVTYFIQSVHHYYIYNYNEYTLSSKPVEIVY